MHHEVPLIIIILNVVLLPVDDDQDSRSESCGQVK